MTEETAPVEQAAPETAEFEDWTDIVAALEEYGCEEGVDFTIVDSDWQDTETEGVRIGVPTLMIMSEKGLSASLQAFTIPASEEGAA